MILLDTNVISELSRFDGHKTVFDWAQTKTENELYLCAPVIAELEFGAQLYKYRTGSTRHLQVLEAIISKAYAGRILPMTLEAARLAGQFKAAREARGKPVASADMYIAGIAAAHGAALSTRNIRDFEGLDLKLVNPFEG